MNFHELCKSERPLILPGAFDALSARLIKQAGFKAYFTGGFPTIGARWGLPDIGLEARLLRSEEHTSELQSQSNLVCRLLLEKKKKKVKEINKRTQQTKLTD